MARSTASDPDQEYVYFMGSETLPSASLWGRKRFLLPVIKNIYTLWGRKRFLLPVLMGSETLPSASYTRLTNLVYPFTLRVRRI